MKLYCNNCGHMFKQGAQAYVKEHFYIKFGANVTSQYVSTVGLNEATIRKYIQDQEKHDIALDKLSVKEYEDPFNGSK